MFYPGKICDKAVTGQFAIALALVFAFPFKAVSADIPPVNLVMTPTAGLIPKGALAMHSTIYAPGGMQFGLRYGLFSFITLGISYGADNIIGEGKIIWNSKVGGLAKLRIINESFSFPALALGVDTQGFGQYSRGRYFYKSPGAFFVFSKNYYFLGGDLSFHAGANYSFLEKSDKDSPDFFGGIFKDFGTVSFKIDYRLALDDRGCQSCGRGRGYLNFGVSLFPTKSRAELEFLLMDILKNKDDGLNRQIRLSFITNPF